MFHVHDFTGAPALSIDGGGGSNTLQGPDAANTWQVSGANAGTLDGKLHFASVQTLLGGAAADTFAFQTGGSLSGKIDGAGGINALDYSGYKGDILVDLLLHTGSLVGQGVSNVANVTGSQGNDLIVGDANANVLVGGTGRNVLIGDGGGDTLTGGGGFNLLIGSATSYDANLAALQALMQYWDNPGATTLDALVNPLKSKKGVTVNGQALILNSSTVQTDNAADSLIGGGGATWFIRDKDGDTLNNGKPIRSIDRLTVI
jgi:Ca2+-binding RTX toxin-like protein